jgi:hypothetical protein
MGIFERNEADFAAIARGATAKNPTNLPAGKGRVAAKKTHRLSRNYFGR